jgi:predicted O-methyltransferase YrrM
MVTIPTDKDERVQTERKLALEPVMSPQEVEWLREAAADRRVVLELGSLAGGSLSVINEVADDDALLVSVDPYHFRKFPGWDPRARFQQRFASEISAGRIVQINERSQDALASVLQVLSERRVDFLHIDGDHRGPAVISDLELYPQLVEPGGIICGHDYDRRHVGLREAVDAVYGDRIRLADAMWWVEAE